MTTKYFNNDIKRKPLSIAIQLGGVSVLMSTAEGSRYSVKHSAPRGLTWQNVNGGEETREVRRRKKDKEIIAMMLYRHG